MIERRYSSRDQLTDPTNRFDPTLDAEVREFSRSLLKKTSQAAGVIQDENIRSVEGVGTYGNYLGKWSLPHPTTTPHPPVPRSLR